MSELIESKLQIGDFVKNTIHEYTTFLYKKYVNDKLYDPSHIKMSWVSWDGLIISVETDNFIKCKTFRSELDSELEKVPSTLHLISKAKEYLNDLNEINRLDNLSYVEILYKLNEQEKELQNDQAI